MPRGRHWHRRHALHIQGMYVCMYVYIYIYTYINICRAGGTGIADTLFTFNVCMAMSVYMIYLCIQTCIYR